MSDSGVIVRRAYTNPLQIEYAQVCRDMRTLVARKRHIREQMRTGTCECCGLPFSRIRATKRFCSLKCDVKWHHDNDARHSYSIPEIRSALPAIIAAGLLSERNLDIVHHVLANMQNTFAASEEIGISHQRVSQVLKKATKMARLVQRVKSADKAVSA